MDSDTRVESSRRINAITSNALLHSLTCSLVNVEAFVSLELDAIAISGHREWLTLRSGGTLID